jgi:site-specific DNA-methyltransferase (adenine-specific)
MIPLDTIIQGDCLEEMKKLPDGCIDLTVTSPPYDNLRKYNGYVFDFEGIAQQLFRITKSGGVVVWVVGDATIDGSETGTSFRQALYFKGIGFNLHDTMIWNKGAFSAVGALQTRYAPVFEYMFIFCKGKIKTFNPIDDHVNKCAGQKLRGTKRNADGSMKPVSNKGRILSDLGRRFNIWDINAEKANTTTHPAPFSKQLASDHILSWSNPGDLILDPMCGSGTTCKMAKYHQRHFLGIDISEEYCEIARKRVAAVPARLDRWAEAEG